MLPLLEAVRGLETSSWRDYAHVPGRKGSPGGKISSSYPSYSPLKGGPPTGAQDFEQAFDSARMESSCAENASRLATTIRSASTNRT
jgi:hypothetical protein